MAAHQEISLRGFIVRSYGTGREVKLPGRTAQEPAVFPFNTSYERMRDELRRRDEKHYTANGVLAMLERNAKIKRAPEKWREAREHADIVLTFEERIFEAVMDDFIISRPPIVFAPGYVVNLETRDTHSDATVGAKIAGEIVEALDACENLDMELEGVVKTFEEKTGESIMVAPVFW